MVSFQDRENEEVETTNDEDKEELTAITWQVHLCIPA